MEADWSVEIAEDAPVIDTGWPGWVNLSASPSSLEASVQAMPEVRQFPPLGAAILRLNHPANSFSTTKCDFWLADPAVGPPVDPLEYDAAAEDAGCVSGCYVDLLPRDPAFMHELAEAERWARSLVTELRALPCRQACAEIVLRRAYRTGVPTIGATFYLSACGLDFPAAQSALGIALQCAIPLFVTLSTQTTVQ